MRTRTPFPIRKTYTVAIAGLLVLAVAGALLVRGGGDEEDDHTLTAYFIDASPLVTGNTVKSSGVIVGEITNIAVEDGVAAVTMELEPSVLPLSEDATATIRAKSLLGERYVDLDPGGQAPEMDLPGDLPVKQTSRALDIQDVLNSLDQPTSASLAALLTTLGEGTSGQGRKVQKAIALLAPTLLDLNEVGVILDDQNAVLNRLLERVTPVAEALADEDGRSLDRVVTASDQALASVSDQQAALDQALRRLPEALRTFRATVQEVTALGDDTTITLRGLRPVTSQLPPISRELRAFANAADPALAALPEVLERAEVLIDQAAPVVKALAPGVRSLRGASPAARRLMAEIQPNLQVVLDFVRGWAMSTNGMDGLGNYFRGVVAYTPQDLLQAPGIPLGLDPDVEPTDEGSTDDQPTGDLPVDDVLGGLGLDDGVRLGSRGSQRPGGSATGLTTQQEQDLLGMLLGGGGR
jgi:phospholipid/cholesterol/gamma-HCH transport system substrate-binding protein